MTLKTFFLAGGLLLTTTFLAVLSAGVGSGPMPAEPNKKSHCSDCHKGTGVAIAVEVVRETATETTYSVSGSTDVYDGQVGWGVFDSSEANLAHGFGSGTFTLPLNGQTYRVFWVNAARDGRGGGAYEDVTALPDLQVEELTTNQEGGIVVRWPSVPGRFYSIQYAELTGQTLEWRVAQANYPAGKGSSTAWTDDGAGTPSPPSDSTGRSYRIQMNP